MSSDGYGAPTNLPKYNAADSQPAFSPDGTKIAFMSNRDEDGGEIYTMNADGSSPTNFTQFQGAIDVQPDWGATCTINGTAGSDTLVGTAGDDFICALSGNDRITGGSGNDVIVGGPGRDRLFGEAGNDLLNSKDRVKHNDRLNGGDGTDICTLDRKDKKVSCP
ncbi:MAG TPA: hypothetical protein VK276_05700 [Rubrobacteraceae bacterium]|jgi:hypothetical protein|nr:hypothetical protein [Rubrobacteraceae bacterium]